MAEIQAHCKYRLPSPRVSGYCDIVDPDTGEVIKGSRMMWFDRGHNEALYGDQHCETLTVIDRSHGRADGTRTLHIAPDVLLAFRDLPFSDGTFRLVAFDPPHLVRAGLKSWMAAKYGKLGTDRR